MVAVVSSALWVAPQAAVLLRGRAVTNLVVARRRLGQLFVQLLQSSQKSRSGACSTLKTQSVEFAST